MKAWIAAGCMLALAATAHAEDECPAAFQGAKVTATKAPGGVTIEFRNGNRDSVSPMRSQLREVAEMIEQHGTQMQTVGEEDQVEFPPVDIDVKDIVLGARVTVRASRLRDITALREMAYGFAEFWKTSPCVETLVSVREIR